MLVARGGVGRSQPIRSGESQLLRRPMSNSGLAVALPRGPPLMLPEGANVAGGTGLFQVAARQARRLDCA